MPTVELHSLHRFGMTRRRTGIRSVRAPIDRDAGFVLQKARLVSAADRPAGQAHRFAATLRTKLTTFQMSVSLRRAA